MSGYTTQYLHKAHEVFELFDEMVNSLSGLSKKENFYLKEALQVMDEFLEIKSNWEKDKKINRKDLFHVEQLVKKYSRFMSNISHAEHFDNSFIYKYISEISETLVWGEYPSLVNYTNETPGQDETISEVHEKIVKFLMDKLKISKLKADKIIQKAAERGIDILKIQTRWSVLAPSLMSLVAEYDPREK